MNIGLLAMSAKPYHAGHDGLVRIAADECDEVHLFVSTSDRARKGEMTIYGSDMKRIWDEFIEPSLPSNVIVTYGGSPVQHVYKDLEDAEAGGDEESVFVIYSDNEDILKYTDSSLGKSAPTLLDNGQIELRGVDRNETVNVSGTKMRALLAAGNVKQFAKLLPSPVRGNAAEIINILTRNSIGEALLRKYVSEILA
jgi:Citrate lyase ligase C-terminal domain